MLIEENVAPAAEIVEGAPEVLPPAEESAKLEGAPEEKEGTPEGAISDADRTKYAIPAKFKDWNAVVKWGSEAEKAKSKAESDKGESERKNKEYEEMLAELNESKDKPAGGLSTDEKTEMAAKFQEDFSTDPIGTMQKLFSEFENRIQSKSAQARRDAKWEKEEAEISKDPAYKDSWASDVKPELIKIAKERPHLTSFDELLAIYERNKGRETKFNKDDSDAKKAAKLAALAESGSNSGGISEDLMKKIASAKNQEELEKLAPRIK